MRKIYSSIKHCPPLTYGDCFRACVASLLETPDVPHVLHDNCGAALQRQRLDLWLAPRGLAFIEFPLRVQSIEAALSLGSGFTQYCGIHYMLSGMTRKDTGHYIVCQGNAIAHNPAPGVHIIRPFDDGVFWLGLIADRL